MVTRMPLRLTGSMIVVLACVLTACSSETIVTSSSSPSLSRATATQSVAPSSTVEQTAEPADGLVGFTSPTGAIGCMLDDAFVRCDVRENVWNLPPRPAECEFDYGQGVSLAAGEEAAMVCAGDTTLGAGEPLAYGMSITRGSLSCESTQTGVTCRDARGGHGFTVARETYALF